jgi:hypothetical protein
MDASLLSTWRAMMLLTVDETPTKATIPATRTDTITGKRIRILRLMDDSLQDIAANGRHGY